MKMMKINGWAIALGVLALTACSNDEDFEQTTNSNKAWTVSGVGMIAPSQENTRALSIGGSDGQTLFTNWMADEKVMVVRGTTKIGELGITVDATNPSLATIGGEMDGTEFGANTFAVGDEVTYYTPTNTPNWTGQTGSIASLSAHNFLKATVTVRQINAEEKAIKMSGASFGRMGGIRHFRFQDQGGKTLKPEQLIIHAENGKLIKSIAANGTKTYGDIVVNTEDGDWNGYAGEHPYDLYVALANDDQENKTNYTFDVKVGSKVYTGPTAAWNVAIADNSYGGVRRVLTHDKTAVMTPMASQKEMIVGTKSVRTVNDVKIGSISIMDACRCSITYSSDNTAVATVDASTGEVTAVAVGTATITASLAAGEDWDATSASYTVEVKELTTQGVDLGLSVRWADMNVGADSETNVGTFFAWGETDGYTSENDYDKNYFGWDTYKFAVGGSINAITKYVTSTETNPHGYNGFYDDKTVLEPEDDAANYNWGGNWRMPTFAEIYELRATKWNTTNYQWTFYDGTTNQYNGSTQKGWKITYKTTGAYIFIPSGGYFDYGSLKSTHNSYYWGSTIYTNTDASGASGWFFDGTGTSSSGYSRRLGRLVRPVMPKP